MQPLAPDAGTLLATGFSASGRPELSGARTAREAETVAREFEGFFLSQMLQAMFAGLETPAPFGGGSGEDMFRGLLVEEYGKLLSKNGGIGLADSLKAEILRLQEIEPEAVV